MAVNKNQHFVPRCYLRPFTLGAEGKAINLFNIDLARAIPRAPVKGQCSGDYFYGEGLTLERLLQRFEGQYARCLLDISAEGYRLTGVDATTLRRFWLLQHLRTEAASRTAVEMFEEMDHDLGGLPLGYKTGIKEAVFSAMRVFFERPDLVDDLNVRLVRNKSARKFVTSDNPAILTNRWHLSPRTSLSLAPGLLSAGALGLLPLTPDILLVLFDSDVHYLEHRHGWIDVRREEDVDALNQHQVLSCDANLYFQAWDHREEVADLSRRLASRRPEEHYAISYAVLDSVNDDGTQVFRTIDKAAAKNDAAFIHVSRVTPAPLAWPSFLSWRRGGVAYDSGTGAGISRKATRSPDIAHKKLRLHV